jgi:hypothetical protein
VDRIASAFEKAWLKLPASAKRIIGSHWEAHRNALTFAVVAEDIVRIASTDPTGSLKFNWTLWKIMPSEYDVLAISHELGHVCLVALREEWHLAKVSKIGSKPNWKAIGKADAAEFPCELLNRELMTLWGFDHKGFDQWVQCEVEHGRCELRSMPISESEYKAALAANKSRWENVNGLTAESIIQTADPILKMTLD